MMRRYDRLPAYATGTILAGLITALLILATGCVAPDSGDPAVSPTPTLTSVPVEPVPPANPVASAAPASRAVTAIKNISITRPADSIPVFSPGYPGPVTDALRQFADPVTAEQVNAYLRWDSVQARTNRSETLRIKGLVTGIDESVGNGNVKNDLVLYAGSTDEFTSQVRTSGRSTERGYILASADPSVACHDLAATGRDTDGYLTLIVFPVKTGSHGLYFNESRREILVARGITFELREEELVSRIQFTIDSIPYYKNDEQRNVRLLYLAPLT